MKLELFKISTSITSWELTCNALRRDCKNKDENDKERREHHGGIVEEPKMSDVTGDRRSNAEVLGGVEPLTKERESISSPSKFQRLSASGP